MNDSIFFRVVTSKCFTKKLYVGILVILNQNMGDYLHIAEYSIKSDVHSQIIGGNGSRIRVQYIHSSYALPVKSYTIVSE